MTNFLAVKTPDVSNKIPNYLGTDMLIIGATALIFAYSFLRGYASLVRESISVYVGLVLAASFGKPLYEATVKQAGNGFPVKQAGIQIILLIVPIIVLQFGRRHHGPANHNMIVTALLAFFTSMLIVAGVLMQLDPVALSRITGASNLASWIYDFRLVWLAAVPIAIAVGAVLKPRGARQR